MKRLFIGGLGHTVSEKDLKDRFGKFGDVSDVELITRKDDHGKLLCFSVKCTKIFGPDVIQCAFSLSLQEIL